ncbi:hypothetical protein [Leifsonia sp. WHRI 6310E]|uniref:hypothetical protein n=1 Tax=Leifsonia sp. WHRI 6310E TaxID=3162562 RepID=UPI0032EE14E3
MSSTGEAPQTRRGKIIGGLVAGVVTAALIVSAAAIAINARAGQDAHAQQMNASAEHVRLVAAANAAEATELARLRTIAARRAAEVAAQQAAAAAAAAAQAAAAEEATRQAEAQQEAAVDDDRAATNESPSSAGPVKCPAGTHPNAVDANGNESACEADGPGGEQCQAYDADNNCTNWYKP